MFMQQILRRWRSWGLEKHKRTEGTMDGMRKTRVAHLDRQHWNRIQGTYILTSFENFLLNPSPPASLRYPFSLW